MSETLTEYKFLGAGGHGAVHPWDEWLDGKIRRLRRGQDFTCGTNTMQTHFARAARKRGLLAKTQREDENTIVVQAVPKESGDAPQ